MGPPTLRWTADEEASLRAGVAKYGVGKWRAILNDPQFSSALCHRSNVDLKDKWRNMNFPASNLGSREKGRTALKKSRSTPINDNHAMASSTVTSDISNKIFDVKPLAALPGIALNTSNQKKLRSRLGTIIMEAIKNLNEPMGSDRTAIANYIEEKYFPYCDFCRSLPAKLRHMATRGKLMKVDQKYKLAPEPTSPLSDRQSPKMMLLEDLQKKSSKFGTDDSKILTEAQVDAELAHMATLSAEEAEAAATHAVVDAEACMAEAEAAASEAEAAEANAKAKQAAFLALKNKNATKSVAKA